VLATMLGAGMSGDETASFLAREREPILRAASDSLARMHLRHYESATPDSVQERLSALFEQLVEGVTRRDLGPMIAHAERVAEERFQAGYDLAEVQIAFNALEEASWSRAIAVIDASHLAQALGLIGTVLGAGKDALARRYVSLASGTRAPSLDLAALFSGTA
jgi:hypothetical protein